MLLESLKALQLKSNVIMQSNNAAVASTTTTVGSNPLRHSIVFGSNTGNLTLIVNNISYVFVFTVSGFTFITLNWDDFGDYVKSGFQITWPVGANQFFLQETFVERYGD
jgi:hypothetical protein